MRWSPKQVNILRRDEWLKRERRRQQTTTDLTRTRLQSVFQKGLNLIPLFPGQLRVAAHGCSSCFGR